MTLYPTRMGRLVFFSSTEEQAAQRIAPILSKMVGGYVDPYEMQFTPARGAWTHDVKDVRRFTGTFKRPDLPKLKYTFGSWDRTLSQIANRCRIEIADTRDHRRSDVEFEIFKP
jgi:hypothetical protein